MVNSHLRVSRKGRFNIFPNTRAKIIFYIAISTAYLLVVFILGITMNSNKYTVDYSAKFISPCLQHLFGTDFMGRDMFWRCIKGLSNSILIGILASIVSSFIALVFGVSLQKYRKDLIILLIGGAFFAFAVIEQVILTVMRKQVYL